MDLEIPMGFCTLSATLKSRLGGSWLRPGAGAWPAPYGVSQSPLTAALGCGAGCRGRRGEGGVVT